MSDEQAAAPANEAPSWSSLLTGDMPWWGISVRGAAMGSADIVPGVSGGTMALLLGIYERFISALSNIDVGLIQAVLGVILGGFSAKARQKHFKKIREADLMFLVFLGLGLGVAVIVMSKIIPKLIATYPAHMNGLFFGMILASVLIPYGMMEQRKAQHVVLFLGFTAFAFWFSGLSAFQVEFGLVGLFICGSVAICAMMLPGVSGSFLLLILGQYTVVLAAAHKLDIITLAVFAGGCLFGLLSFSRVLKWLLATFHSGMLAALCGLMIGSLQKVWPYKDASQQVMVGKKVVSSGANVLPWAEGYSGDMIGPAALLVTGFIAVLVIDRVGGKKPAHD